jgi:hypothetical protein
VRYACTRCGAPTSSRTKRCEVHGGQHTGYSPDRDRAAQQRFRDVLLERAGGRCEWVEHGERCTEAEDLRACHLTPLADGGGYDPDDGRLLCAEHDRLTDPRAR